MHVYMYIYTYTHTHTYMCICTYAYICVCVYISIYIERYACTSWMRKSQPTPIFLPGEFREQRSLADYSPWGRRESEMTKRPTSSTTYVYI